MTLSIRVGNDNDMPPKPKNWPSCGSFSFEESINHEVQHFHKEATQLEQNLANTLISSLFQINLLVILLCLYNF